MVFDLLSRRELIWDKLYARSRIEDNGFFLNDRPSPCLIWTGPTSGTGRGGGYGRMCLDGQTVAVHLVAWTNEYGFIPGKKQIDHKCNQRLCWNPSHLEMVTHKTNQKRRGIRAKLASTTTASLGSDSDKAFETNRGDLLPRREDGHFHCSQDEV